MLAWPAVLEGLPDHGDLAVHHAGRAQHVGAGLRLGHRHLAVDLQGGVVVDVAVGVEDAAVAVVGEFVQADVAHDDQLVADLGADVPDGLVQHAVRVQRGGAAGVADGGDAEEHDAADAELARPRPRRA